MANNSFEFKAFGIKDNLQNLIKRTGILEIIFGSYFLVVSALYFFIFVASLFLSGWGASVFKVFGYQEGINLGAMFILLFIIMGAMYLIVASLLLVSGLKAKAYSKNPVLLINGKKDYLAAAVWYIVFMALMLVSIYVCLHFSFSLFIYFILIAFLALLTITLYKFLALKNLPDKENVLDVETLSDDKKEAILLKSSTLKREEKEKKPTQKEVEPKDKEVKTTKTTTKTTKKVEK